LVGIALAGALGAAAPAGAAPIEIDVLSSRADLVSGGDALVRIKVQNPGDTRRLTVHLGGRDVTRQFDEIGKGKVGALLTGIPSREIPLTASNGSRGARIQLTGHPNGGPLISGPHLNPWICQAGAVDADCNQPATYELRAVTDDGFVAYDPKSPPAGIHQTTTTEG
jgi:hypothetical protein